MLQTFARLSIDDGLLYEGVRANSANSEMYDIHQILNALIVLVLF